jgi:tRNA modification GTPase
MDEYSARPRQEGRIISPARMGVKFRDRLSHGVDQPMTDTIFALATPPGRSGVAVIRISGPGARSALQKLGGTAPPPGEVRVRVLRDPQDGAVLDHALTWWRGEGATFTGEDVAEIQCHGGRAVVEAISRALDAMPGMRLANPGEFTRRAFHAGKLDLSQVEGLADLIDAETEGQRRQAVRALEGGLSNQVAEWRRDLVRAVALLEATIDWADEDVPEDVGEEVGQLVADVIASLKAEIGRAKAAQVRRDGVEVALVGRPNAGKSTLFNAILGRSAALTSPVAGTTRDVLEARLDIGGVAVTLLDMAGLNDTDDPIEAAGVARARARARDAHVRIVVGAPDALPTDLGVEVLDEDIRVWNKSDLGAGGEGVPVSAQSGAGVDGLVSQLAALLADRSAGAGVLVRERHVAAVTDCVAVLESGLARVRQGEYEAELVAEDLRAGLRRLRALIGRVDVDDILDVVFSSFCLGK